MMLKIAFRNVLRRKRRSVLTALTMFGGFALSAVSIGWSDGTYNRMIDTFTRNWLGHAQIHAQGYQDNPTLYKTIADVAALGDTLEALTSEVTWTPRLYAAGLSSVGSQSVAVRLIGVDPQQEQALTHIERKISQGRPLRAAGERAVLLGDDLRDRLRASIGDTLVFLSQAADGSLANDLYPIVGVIDGDQSYQDRMSVFLPLATAQELMVLPGRVHEIALATPSLENVDDIVAEIRQRLEGADLEVHPWRELARSFYQAMQADKQGMWIMILVIMLIVAIGVLNTVLMSVLERTREYGALKAIGTHPGQIFWQVIAEVEILAGFSLVLGSLLALAANGLLARHGIALPEPFSYGGVTFDTMYTEVNARSFYLSGLTVVLSATLVSLYPALRAARIRPARAMRMT